MNRSRRAAGIPSFTIVELLMVIGVILILLGLTAPGLAGTRQGATELACVARGRSMSTLVTAYCADFKDVFPTGVSDTADSLPLARPWRVRYLNQAARFPIKPFWHSWTGPSWDGASYRCAADTPSRRAVWGTPIDFTLTNSCYFSPEAMTKSLSLPRANTARMQTLASVVFPSAKVFVYEHEAWHGFSGTDHPGTIVDSLDYRQSPRPTMTIMFDGHGGLRRARDAAEAVPVFGFLGPTVFGTPADGIRGRDIR